MTTQGWHSEALLGFDTETTGTDTTNDRILSAAIVSDDDVSHWLINPGVEVPPAAAAVHGITAQRLADEGQEPPTALSEVATALTKAAKDGVPVVVYRAGFDLTLLSHELERHGLEQVPWQQLRVIDPFVLDKRCDKWRRGKRTLGVTCAHYGVALDDAHDATADARASVALARAIAAAYPTVATASVAELHLSQVAWHADQAASLEAYFRRSGRTQECDRRWPLQRSLPSAVKSTT